MVLVENISSFIQESYIFNLLKSEKRTLLRNIKNPPIMPFVADSF